MRVTMATTFSIHNFAKVLMEEEPSIFTNKKSAYRNAKRTVKKFGRIYKRNYL
jgi:hypothetical protein